MLQFIRSLGQRREQDGASAVEYGLLVAGIAGLIVAVVFLFGGVIKSAFKGTCDKVAAKNSGVSGAVANCN